jgi:hypothetical protein
MKTIIKIVITLVLLTACFNAGRVAFNNFQFEDAAQQRLLFDSRASDEEVMGIVMKLAAEYAVPLKEENVDIKLIGQDRVVEMTYTADVQLVPGFLSYPWTFTPKTSTRMLVGVGR